MNFLKNLKKNQIIKLIISSVFILILISTLYHSNNTKKKTFDKNYVFLPALMDSDAKFFLDNMVLDLGIKSKVISATKDINLGKSLNSGKYANEIRKLNGYIISPTSLKSNWYFRSKKFKVDENNTTNISFNNTTGYTDGTIMCVNSINTIDPNTDNSDCTAPPIQKCTADGKCINISRCSLKSETFCADLNQ